MIRRSRLLNILLVSVLLPLAGLSQAADWPRQVVTDNGTVTLKSAPKRIVSTRVTLTGSLLAIDALWRSKSMYSAYILVRRMPRWWLRRPQT